MDFSSAELAPNISGFLSVRVLSFCIVEGQEMPVRGLRTSSALVRFGSVRKTLATTIEQKQQTVSVFLSDWPGGC